MKNLSKTKALFFVFILILGSMTGYEFIKQELFPAMSVWVSHVVTVIYTTVAGLLCGSFLYDKFMEIFQSQEKIEQKLRQTKERYRQSQVYANIGTWALDIQSGELYWSEQIGPLFGRDKGEQKVTYDYFLDAVHPEDREKVSQAVQNCIDGKAKYNIDHRVIWPDGTIHWLNEKGDVDVDKEGSALKMLGVVSDITNRKRVEESLKKSERNLGEAQRIAKLGSWSRNLVTGATVWSDERYRIFGYEPGEIEASSANFKASIYPGDYDRVMAAIDVATASRQSYEIECRIVRPDGQRADVQIRGEFTGAETGAQDWVNGTVLDITERKAAEKMLRKLSRALEQSPSAVFITNVEGNIEYVNPKFTQMSGYSSQDVLGKNPRILKSSHTPASVHTEMWKTIASGNEWRGELKDRHKNGTKFWAYVTIAPVKDDRGQITHYVATHEDISQRKNSEYALEMALKLADVANRAKTELLANMSHELRTPLNAIIGFSSTIQAEIFGPVGCDKYKEYIDDIADSGQHLLELINDILDVSAIEVGKLELNEDQIDTSALVKASLQLVKHRAEEGNVKLVVDVSDKIPVLYADERRMKQIIINLMTNAIKFTPPQGQVSLTIAEDMNDHTLISIADTGIGMDKEELAKAMTQFGQVSRGSVADHEGTGLGLPLTKGLVELHGGTMEIESKKGAGTIVLVRIPQNKVGFTDFHES